MDIESRLLSQWEEVERIKKSKIIPREKRVLLNELKDTGRIKVIIGPRRAGKSTFLISEIVDDNAYYVNFDDEILSTLRADELGGLITQLHRIFGKRNKLVLDEIQNIDRWELFVNRLQRQGYNVFITGSNSALLSSELATHLTGRHITIELLPFSFREFLKAKNVKISFSEKGIGELQRFLEEYLYFGGFPEVVLEENERIKMLMLKEMFHDVLIKDIVRRKAISKPNELINLAKIVCSNTSGRVSYRKLGNSLGLSPHTIKKYVSYLEEAYLCFGAPRFSFKKIEIESSIKKWFVYDLGYFTINKGERAEEKWRRLESIVAIELKRRNLPIFYYLAEKRYEVDLVSNLIFQITYDIDKMPKREKIVLEKAMNELNLPGKIISWSGSEDSLPLYKFLLQYDEI